MQKSFINIKRELNSNEVENLIKVFSQRIKHIKELPSLFPFIQDFVKSLTPAQKVCLLYFDSSLNTLYSVDPQYTTSLNITLPSMISQVWETNQPLFSNDIGRTKQYNPSIDNFPAYRLQKLMLIPIRSHMSIPIAILWAAIPEQDINQFISKDIDNVSHLLECITWENITPSSQQTVSIAESTTDEINFSSISLKKSSFKTPISLIGKIKTFFSKKTNTED